MDNYSYLAHNSGQHVLYTKMPTKLSPTAELALWLVAGGIPKLTAAQRAGLSQRYVRKLCASPAGREFIARVADDARREIGVALALAS